MAQIDALKTDEIQNYEIEHQEEVRRLAGECMVILENDVKTFRLHKGLSMQDLNL